MVAAAGETVRAAGAAEATRIAQVIRAAFAEYRGVLHPPSGALAVDTAAVKGLIETGGVLVCESGGQIVACVHHQIHEDHVYLGRLSVLPEYRGRGLAARLVAEVEALAASAGRGRVRLGVRLALPRNRAFFEALGYRQVGLDSHAGMTVPTFVWLEKPVGCET
jgi:ribosomal protein S18 acetylase RimI-like enzyme